MVRARDGKRVLVVEDTGLLRRTLVRMLRSMGCSPVEAENGRKALKIAQEDKVDAILLDVGLPGMDGFEVLEFIRKNPRLKDTPVIICSARGRRTDIMRARSLGATDYVVKPVSMRALRSKLTEATAPAAIL